MKYLCLGQFLSNYCSYSQWYLADAYSLAWPFEGIHPYLTLTSILQSIRYATLSYLLIKLLWILVKMFALFSSLSARGWCEGVVYLSTPGCRTDIGLQLGKACYPCKQVREEGECFYFFCFFTFIPVPLSSLSLSFISSTISSISFLLSLGDNTKWPTRFYLSLNPNTIKKKNL